MRLLLGAWIGVLARMGMVWLVFFASAAYGLTRDWTIEAFNMTGGVVLAVWAASLLVEFRLPRIRFTPALLTFIILGVGWAVTYAGWQYDLYLDGKVEVSDSWADVLLYLGTYDVDESIAAMIRTSVLLGLMLMAIEMFRSPPWQNALLLSVFASALGMVILFLLQKTVGGPFNLIREDGRDVLNFATFRYWGNAASYLTLTWPLGVAYAVHFLSRRSTGWTIWLGAALLVFSANFLNRSKAGQVMGALGALLLAGPVIAYLRSQSRFRTSRTALLVSAVPIAILIAGLVLAIPTERWQKLANTEVSDDKRILAYEHFVKMLPDADWLGFGPGTFKLAYWNYVEDDKRMRRLAYWVAHEDYIQTIVEWGYAGAALWGLLFIPAWLKMLVGAFKKRARPPAVSADAYAFFWKERIKLWINDLPGPTNPLVLLAGSVSLVLIGLHATIDFPMQIESIQFYFLIWVALGWSIRLRDIK